jgi:hypothetical protein
MYYLPTNSVYLNNNQVADVVREKASDDRGWRSFGFLPGSIIPLTSIRVGETCYRLRETLQGEFLPVGDGTCEFWVERLSPQFVGRGARADEAYRDWRDRVHESFQDLYGKRPFEMTAEEVECWDILVSMLDVVAYRNEAPLLVRQVGRIVQARPLPRRVTWVDGRSETINLDDMPAEFASYKPGQPFEADVERDPMTFKIRRVRFVRRISEISPLKKAELERFWQSLPGTQSLPISTNKWTEP